MNIELLRNLLLMLGISVPGFALNAPTLPTAAQTHRAETAVEHSKSTDALVTHRHKTKPTATPTPTATATPVPTATPAPVTAAAEIASEQTCPGQADVAKTATVLTCMTAQARIFQGLAPVSASAKLMAAAAAKDQDMLRCGYSHTACGRAFDYQMTQSGYTGHCTAENIAYGQKTPGEVFKAWMNSTGHRENILGKDYRDIGVAELAGPNGPLWVMELGGC